MIAKVVISKFQKVSKNFLLNLFASLLTTGVAQLVLYPVLAVLIPSEAYGELLTVMGIANTVAVACGGSLNNVRLILQEKYNEGSERGDFSVLLWGMTSISFFVLLLIFNLLYNQPLASSILVTLYSVLCLIKTYVQVEYQFKLQYERIVFSNLFVAAGNLLGLFALKMSNNVHLWPLPFVLGEIAGFFYLLFSTKIIKEKIKPTNFFPLVAKKEGILLLSAISANILVYLDRLLLLPLLGGRAVGSYTVASVFGKSLGILMGPLAGVLLSYYAQKGFKMNRKLFWKINFSTICMGILFSILSLIISPLFTKLLYPSLYEEAAPYLAIANISAIVGIMANMIMPSILKFVPTIWQLLVQGVYCVLYLGGGVLATRMYSLRGFAIMALVTSTVKLLLLFALGQIFIQGEE